MTLRARPVAALGSTLPRLALLHVAPDSRRSFPRPANAPTHPPSSDPRPSTTPLQGPPLVHPGGGPDPPDTSMIPVVA